MFKVADCIKVNRMVKIAQPDGNGVIVHEVEMSFALYPVSVVKTKENHEVIIGWDSNAITREGENGSTVPVPYSKENLDWLFSYPWAARAIMNAYNEANMGLYEKN